MTETFRVCSNHHIFGIGPDGNGRFVYIANCPLCGEPLQDMEHSDAILLYRDLTRPEEENA